MLLELGHSRHADVSLVSGLWLLTFLLMTKDWRPVLEWTGPPGEGQMDPDVGTGGPEEERCQMFYIFLVIWTHQVFNKSVKWPIEEGTYALASWLSWLKHHPAHQKGCGFKPPSGCMPRLWLDPQLGRRWEGGTLSMFLLHTSLPLPPLPLSKVNKHILG